MNGNKSKRFFGFFALAFMLALVGALPLAAQAKDSLAMLPFSGGNPGDGDYMVGELARQRELRAAFSNKITPVTNTNRMFMVGETDQERVKRLGVGKNAQYVLAGSVTKLGALNKFAADVLDIKDFVLVDGYSERYTALADGIALMPKLAGNLSGVKMPSKRASGSAPAVSPTQTAKGTYTIGGTGPAGGIIFYDKGVSLDGWRYLEAAPQDFASAEWGSWKERVGGTQTAVGSGKRNTQFIVDFLRANSESGRAAQLCAGYTLGGYSDWFLPSRDELDLMYENLKAKGLGNFTNGWYWSSSESGNKFAWGQRFSDGGQEVNVKGITDSVRAVRAF